ncbi:MAG: hypothetical protein IT525_13925 [Nitrosomonas sp.]|nr:hypothetical protein [Nitrosomonas sp.]
MKALEQHQLIHLTSFTILLLVTLKVNTIVFYNSSTIWIAGYSFLALLLAHYKFAIAELPLLKLLQLLGGLSALFSFFHYPLMPLLPTVQAEVIYVAVWIGWLISIICGFICFRIPSFALFPAAYLLWSIRISRQVTGLPHDHKLDVMPIVEVATSIGISLIMIRFYNWIRPNNSETRDKLACIALIVAIGIHIANYFWSFVAKIMLDGPFLAWITFNNPLYIYLAALDSNHIVFSDWPMAIWIAEFLDHARLPLNFFVLISQGAAIFAFLLRKHLLILLLLIFDAMHIAIALSAGANFWPWILLNVAITVVVVSPKYQQPSMKNGLLAALLILVLPFFANIAYLGWYDSGAHNKRYFEAEDKYGHRFYISPNYFTFYSYPIAHLSYGVPEPSTAFATGMNSGTGSYEEAVAARTCDLSKLVKPWVHENPDSRLDTFIVNYHRMVEKIKQGMGWFPYNWQPHHFYVHPDLMEPFEKINISDIVAYIYRRESSCLTWDNGQIQRRFVSSGEYRIELPYAR